ncbi:MAG: HAD family phosphatase [Caldilinea sp. CFX5]|nr:HAD family phosphatase [Caldilinea sp. CFX5]
MHHPTDLRHLRAAVFDMDGLMVDTESIYQAAWRDAIQQLGYTISEAALRATTGRRMADCYAILRGAVDDTFPMPAFLDLWPRLWHDHVNTHGINQKPGLTALLDLLDAHQIPKAVATSSEQAEALFTLEKANLLHRFSIIVSGDQIVNGKPAPDIFLCAAERLNIAPERCMAFEDSEAGVMAASSAGMVTIMVPEIEPVAEVVGRAYRVYDSLHEAKELIQKQWLPTATA